MSLDIGPPIAVVTRERHAGMFRFPNTNYSSIVVVGGRNEMRSEVLDLDLQGESKLLRHLRLQLFNGGEILYMKVEFC